MNTSLFELPAVLAILSVVCVVLVRAFAAARTDGVDVFRKPEPRELREKR